MNAEEVPSEAVEEEPTPEPEAEPTDDDSGIGARVTAVFTAAEKAGQHIVSLAREARPLPKGQRTASR